MTKQYSITCTPAERAVLKACLAFLRHLQTDPDAIKAGFRRVGDTYLAMSNYGHSLQMGLWESMFRAIKQAPGQPTPLIEDDRTPR